MVKIHTVGGFSEVGKNMIAIETEEDAFILDEGFYLPAIIEMQEQDKGKDEYSKSEKKMKAVGAIPNDTVLNNIRHKVCAQFVSHAHLDHVGAVPFMSDKYRAPIYATPFTVGVLDALLKDEKLFLKNDVHAIKPNTSFYIRGKNKKYLVDFISATHSTTQSSMIAIHLPEGVILYTGDFKIDDTPILGPKTNYKKLKEIAKEGVLAVIVDSLYSGSDKKTPSEKIARSLLEEVMSTINNKNSAIIVTTFSSHIARLKSITEFSKRMNREVIFLGRSLNKYSLAAKESGVGGFINNVTMSKYAKQVEKTLHKVEKNRGKYVVVCTGHQGEPGSILERISRNKLPFNFKKEDNIVFSSSVIPTEVNIEQFAKMEGRLKKKPIRLFRDVHVSGHGGKEDLRELIKLVKPQHIIPFHGDTDKTEPMAFLSQEMGFRMNKQIHLMQDGGVVKI